MENKNVRSFEDVVDSTVFVVQEPSGYVKGKWQTVGVFETFDDAVNFKVDLMMGKEDLENCDIMPRIIMRHVVEVVM